MGTNTPKPSRIVALITVVTLALATQVQANVIHLNISHMFNNDVVVTPEERSYASDVYGGTVQAAFGQHSMGGGAQAYLSTAMPAGGLFDDGYFEFGKGLDRKYDQEDPSMGPMHNSVRWNRSSITVDLLPEQRQQYADIVLPPRE